MERHGETKKNTGRSLRVETGTHEGRRVLDVREFVGNGESATPTTKGVRAPISSLPSLTAQMLVACRDAVERGMLSREDFTRAGISHALISPAPLPLDGLPSAEDLAVLQQDVCACLRDALASRVVSAMPAGAAGFALESCGEMAKYIASLSIASHMVVALLNTPAGGLPSATAMGTTAECLVQFPYLRILVERALAHEEARDWTKQLAREMLERADALLVPAFGSSTSSPVEST